MLSMLETKEQEKTNLNSVEYILQEITKFYPDFDPQKQHQLALLLKSVSDSPTTLQLIRPTEPSSWQVTKEVCEKYLVYVNGAKIPAQELEALNQKAAKLCNDHIKPKYDQIIGLYSQAIKKYSRSALLYLFRAQFSLYAYSIPEIDIKTDLEMATRLYECKLDNEPNFLKVFSKTYRNVLLFNSNIESSIEKQNNYLSCLKTEEEKLAAEREFLATIKFLVEKVRVKKLEYAVRLDNFVRKHYEKKPEFKEIVDDIHRQVEIDKKLQATQQTAQLKDSFYSHKVTLTELDAFLKQTFPLQQKEQLEEKAKPSEDKKAKNKQKQLEETAKLKALQLEEEKRNEQVRLEEEEKERARAEAEIKAKKEKKKQEKEERRLEAEKRLLEQQKLEEDRIKRELEKAALQIKKKEEKKARQLARKALAESTISTTTAVILNSLESAETPQQPLEVVISSADVEEKSVDQHPVSTEMKLIQPVPVRVHSVDIAQVEKHASLRVAQESIAATSVNPVQILGNVGFDNTAYLLQYYQQMNIQLQQANYLMQLQLANQFYQQQLAQTGMMGYPQQTSYAANPNGFQYTRTNHSRHKPNLSQKNVANNPRSNLY